MLRFFIAADKQSTQPEIASRFPEIAFDWVGGDSGEAADAVAFIGSFSVEAAIIDQALRAGRHVLYAGEPTFTSSELESFFSLAGQQKAVFAIVNRDHFLPSRQIIKAQIPDKIGNVGLLRMHRWERAIKQERSLTTLPGPLLRDFDLAVRLVGELPNVVHAFENLEPTGRSMQVHLGFAHGGMALISYDNRLSNGDGYQSLSVIGSSGATYADDHQNAQLLYRGGRPQAIRTDETIKALADMIQWFVNAIQTGDDASANAFDWQRVFPIAEAVMESLRTRQAVVATGRNR